MEKVVIGNAELYLGDCLEILPTLGKVDAVITDPPYGILDKMKGGTWGKGREEVLQWDDEPLSPVILEILLKSATFVCLWGANYYAQHLNPSSGWLVWDKVVRGMTLSDAELAWTSTSRPVRTFSYCRGNESGFAPKFTENKIFLNCHPTQKPVPLMQWCIQQAGEAVSVCDPFMGSGSTGVAAMNMQRQFIGIEREPRYFELACKRIEQSQMQLHLGL